MRKARRLLTKNERAKRRPNMFIRNLMTNLGARPQQGAPGGQAQDFIFCVQAYSGGCRLTCGDTWCGWSYTCYFSWTGCYGSCGFSDPTIFEGVDHEVAELATQQLEVMKKQLQLEISAIDQ